jgi:isopenicillin-N N-acyltransferase-like protein
MLTIQCSGSPYEVVLCIPNSLQPYALTLTSQIGFQHGSQGAALVISNRAFYKAFFSSKASMEWPAVQETALEFLPILIRDWLHYVEEMRGVADGAKIPFEDVLAVNVRTEISFGAFNDGCTSLSWTSGSASILAQNWDVR